jgi:hypothetical protein
VNVDTYTKPCREVVLTLMYTIFHRAL